MRLDRLINKLIEIRNVVTYHDYDYQIERELADTEQSIETLAQEVDSELKDL
jgi:hypothetical protein